MFGSEKGCALQFPSCLSLPSESDELLPNMAREPIVLNVYDMVGPYDEAIFSSAS